MYLTEIQSKIYEAHSLLFKFEPGDPSKATPQQLKHGNAIHKLVEDGEIPAQFGQIVFAIAGYHAKPTEDQIKFFTEKHQGLFSKEKLTELETTLRAHLNAEIFKDYYLSASSQTKESIIQKMVEDFLSLVARKKNSKGNIETETLADLKRQLFFEAILVADVAKIKEAKEDTDQVRVLGTVAQSLDISEEVHQQMEQLGKIETQFNVATAKEPTKPEVYQSIDSKLDTLLGTLRKSALSEKSLTPDAEHRKVEDEKQQASPSATEKPEAEKQRASSAIGKPETLAHMESSSPLSSNLDAATRINNAVAQVPVSSSLPMRNQQPQRKLTP